MDAESIRQAVLQSIAAIAPEVDTGRLRPDVPLREQVELDSLDWLNVVAAVEQRLGVPIAAGDRQRLTTLDALVAELTTRTAAAPRAVSDLRPSQHTVGSERVTVRPLSREDAPLEADFVRSLSAESRYMRFQAALRELPPAKLRFLTDVDQQRHVALAATVRRDGGEAIVGVARYAVDDDGGDCEFAIAVRDDWQRTGVAGLLMQRLIDVARARPESDARQRAGIQHAHAEVHAPTRVRRRARARRRHAGSRHTRAVSGVTALRPAR